MRVNHQHYLRRPPLTASSTPEPVSASARCFAPSSILQQGYTVPRRGGRRQLRFPRAEFMADGLWSFLHKVARDHQHAASQQQPLSFQ